MKKILKAIMLGLFVVPMCAVMLSSCKQEETFVYTRDYINANLTGDFSVTYEINQNDTETNLIIKRKGENYYAYESGSNGQQFFVIKNADIYKVYEKQTDYMDYDFEKHEFKYTWEHVQNIDANQIFNKLFATNIYAVAVAVEEMGVSTIKQRDTTEIIAGIECIVFDINDNTTGTVSVDKETGIYMAAKPSDNRYTVTCTEFVRGDDVVFPEIPEEILEE